MMTFLVLYSIILAYKGLSKAEKQIKADCGMKIFRREPRFEPYSSRSARIIGGSSSSDGEFPWQVSLEVLHPIYGFLGHWCGGVLIDNSWIISAAHCINNDIFNLPLPALWTAVLGENNRHFESGHEQRISIEKIITHSHYSHYDHDIVLLKLAETVKLDNFINKICLPIQNELTYLLDEHLLNNVIEDRKFSINKKMRPAQRRRINDRFMRFDNEDRHQEKKLYSSSDSLYDGSASKLEPPYIECVATGWGMSYKDGEKLSDNLIKTRVLIFDNERCQEVYGEHVNIHEGHLCGGAINGKGGTCVGDSGGPLNCRLHKNGPWVLAGITSFGSGCSSFDGNPYHPDVYIRISYYIKWIVKTMSQN
ncbi:ovochymase isoform X1 [Sitodiplosis mosellana]|uniref:ovochymase isoform X1 n=1 Tax=Sitodiplosis mosellana TaxID=263140 RepID=UPI00244388FB|nr:ovochymase isoform X1 [Sitodiplosis mosellana]XP_055322953.1 ovochymase isoform X1 [Sitodiplosis mosellana]XP_055322954.1 ovochymase isoform X1 [Sitodiplosis mosellana]XP_055322955.1 ovochymase isoform X1 [Sitodiplosis mosellana]